MTFVDLDKHNPPCLTYFIQQKGFIIVIVSFISLILIFFLSIKINDYIIPF